MASPETSSGTVRMPEPGTLLDGKYRLVRKLGAGGMGVVYEADHVRLRQPFAVKVLQPELAHHREFQGRFEREARAAALLRSPHVVRVFDVDVSNEGLTYMVMELLEGNDLAVEALEGPVPVAALADWIIQACAALQEAHDQGIIHRDLKPANIFLAKIPSGERIAKVVDFGISKVEATSTNVLSVRDGTALGTPTFMSPEQIRGRRVDGRSDLWALGVIMYRILAGRWPFNGSADQQYMSSVLADPPIPFELVRPDHPYELASVIMKALEKDVAHRWQSANELAAALAPFGTGRAPIAPMTSLPPPAMRSIPPAGAAAANDPPISVVVGGGATHVEGRRSPYLDTVVDRAPPNTPANKTAPLGLALAPASPAGTLVFVPPTPAHPNAGGPTPSALAPAATTGTGARAGVALPIAALAAVAIGFGAYMVATSRGGQPPTARDLGSKMPASAAPSSGTGEPPAALPPSIDLPTPSTATASAPASASADPHGPKRRPHRPSAGSGAATASGPTPQPAEQPPVIPDHL